MLPKTTPCLLCGKPPILLGSFIPHNQRAVGATGTKIRTFWYTLCRKCSRKKNTPKRVEDVAFREWAAATRCN